MDDPGNAAPSVSETSERQAVVTALIAAVAAAASAILAVYATATWHAVTTHPVAFVGFLGTAALLQLKVIEVPDEGAVSFANVGMLGAAFELGTGPAMVVGAVAALMRFAAARGRLDRAIFDAATLALASATATATYHAAQALDTHPNDRFGPSVFAAAVFYLVNVGLLSTAMGLSDGVSPFQIWKQRFRWLAPFTLAAGPYAAVTVVVYKSIGITGILAMAIAPAALVAPVGRAMHWTR